MNWKVPRMWEGGDVWIIGGGPSIPQQFDIPEAVIKKVLSGESPPNVYSDYMKELHTKHVIGVNAAFRLGDWIDMVAFGDSGFFLRFRESLAIFPGLKVSCGSGGSHEHWVKYLGRDNNHAKGISPVNGLISWNGNTGAASINIAVHAGAKRIFLLGFDMNLDPSNQMQHWHDLYNKGPVQDDRRRRKLPFPRHLPGFPLIAADAKKLGIEIINISPNSAITDFPKKTLKEVLNECN